MSESEPTQPIEQREQPKIEIWLVDDENINGRMWGMIIEQHAPGVVFTHFTKGEDAIRELEQRLRSGTVPDGIIMDGNLNADQSGGDFDKGVKLVPRIRSMTSGRDKLPYIIAFSATEGVNEEMMSLGADASLSKPFRLRNALVEIKKIEDRA